MKKLFRKLGSIILMGMLDAVADPANEAGECACIGDEGEDLDEYTQCRYPDWGAVDPDRYMYY